MATAILETQNLHKRFGKVHALNGVDLSVENGEVYGFIGPNGAGKSTTIRVLLGILKANEGSARIFGLDAWRDAVRIHRDIAYVPGEANLWANLSGGEAIDLFLRLRERREGRRSGEGRKSRYCAELIERFDFDPTKKCGTYSKGNRQKVALIAAFSSSAELFILDEPTSGLDPLMELVFRECVAEAKARGASVLLSSHILSEVELLCDRISIIRQGRVIDSGTLASLRHLTRNKVVVEADAPLAGLEDLPGVHNVSVVAGSAPATQADVPAAADVSDKAAGAGGTLEAGEVPGFITTFSLDNAETPRLLAFLASRPVRHLTSTPPTLEELFMSHYAG
jgi:ABC-2 type transport system ATP-binding protein